MTSSPAVIETAGVRGAPDPLALAQAALGPGEALVWAERPSPESARRRALPMLIFGLVFTGFAGFWTAQALGSGAPLMALAGVPFVAVGLGLLAAPWWRPKQAKRTVYAITDRRLLILTGWPGHTVRSFAPGDINTLERRERPDGSGDLVFRRELHRVRLGARPGDDHRLFRHRTRERRIGFFGIPDVRRVEAAVLALRNGQPPAS